VGFRRRFDGTPGSLTLDLADMRDRYEHLRDTFVEGVRMSRLLDAAKLLHAARQPYLRVPLLRAVAERIRGRGKMGEELWE
jgi:hypothetical protein